MMDAHNGDCVHVDFSCLFDRGLTLERPELVPFRLTQNMLDGFGPAGPDGAFKRCCEITLQARLRVLDSGACCRIRHGAFE
jgi:serine/threonine-protein kinase ATR